MTSPRIPRKNPKKKPRRLPSHLVPGNPGNAGGRKGRSGRKTLAFAEECHHLTDSAVLEKVGRYLQGHAGPADQAWRWCAEYVTRYTKVEPKRSVELTGAGGEPFRFTLDLDAAAAPKVDDPT